MYFHFVDFEKEGTQRQPTEDHHRIWDSRRAGEVVLCGGCTCSMIDEGEITERFPVATGVKQG